MNNTYRKYKKGDKVAIVGFNGHIYASSGSREFESGYSLGTVTTLMQDEDSELDVKIPYGILTLANTYIHISCISLVKAVDENTKAIIGYEEDNSLFKVETPDETRKIAYIWHDDKDLTREQAEKLANDAKAAYDATH